VAALVVGLAASGPLGAHEAGHEAAPAALPGESLYRLPVQLETADGRRVAPEAWRGRPVVVTMFYGTCKSACPLLTRAMTATEAALPASERGRVDFLMVSLDPARDTVAALAEFAREHALAAPHFTVARAQAKDVRLIAAALGVRYRQLPDGNFSHSSVLTVLDGQGVPRARTETLAGADGAFVAAVRGLLH
jgi:protein SCO1/2